MSELSFNETAVGYDNKELIKEVTFSLEKGEILALVGPNGAGKSTILKSAAGLLPVISGQIMVEGKELSSYRPSDLARIMSVMLTQKNVSNYATCFDVVRVGRFHYTDMFGRVTDGDRAAIEEALKLNGVYDLRDREFYKLSDGQKQRVLLSRAFVSEPALLILDEPTSYLDMGYKVEFFDVLKSYVKRKSTAVLISMHEIELVKKVADTVLCISKDNRIDRFGDPVEILTPEYMEQLFSMSSGKYMEYYGN